MKKTPAAPMNEKVSFSSILAPFWVHFGSQNRCKIVSKNESKIDTPKNRQKEGSKVELPLLTNTYGTPGPTGKGGGM